MGSPVQEQLYTSHERDDEPQLRVRPFFHRLWIDIDNPVRNFPQTRASRHDMKLSHLESQETASHLTGGPTPSTTTKPQLCQAIPTDVLFHLRLLQKQYPASWKNLRPQALMYQHVPSPMLRHTRTNRTNRICSPSGWTAVFLRRRNSRNMACSDTNRIRRGK